jgi:pyridoxine 5-phosphate synthase
MKRTSEDSASPLRLGVNIDHSATLRQARYREEKETCGKMIEPDPVLVALLSEKAGADSITVHLREDRRHIQDRDVWRIREAISTWLNLEMAVTQEMVDLALELKPDSVCLVPESRQEVTTEGGLDVVGQRDRIARVVEAMTSAGIKTSLFIDPDVDQIRAAKQVNAPWIELHTGAFAHAYYREESRLQQLQRLRDAASLASELGLIVNAGHGINYYNIKDIVTIPQLHELNIGHSILSRSMLYGIDEAVRQMKHLMQC